MAELTRQESNALWTLNLGGEGVWGREGLSKRRLWLTARECNVPEVVLVGLRGRGFVAVRRDRYWNTVVYRITAAGKRALAARTRTLSARTR